MSGSITLNSLPTDGEIIANAPEVVITSVTMCAPTADTTALGESGQVLDLVSVPMPPFVQPTAIA